MPAIPFDEPRWLLVRREFDGSLRPVTRCGRMLIYRNPALAAVIAKPYGPSVQVIDTQSQDIPFMEAK